MDNYGIRQVKNQIINFLNGLPYGMEIKRLIVKDIYDELKDAADKVVLSEKIAAEQALIKAKEDRDAKSVQPDSVGELSKSADSAE